MSYEVGTHIDLSNINDNTKTTQHDEPIRRAFVSRSCDVGTEFVFRQTAFGMITAMRIPVVFA